MQKLDKKTFGIRLKELLHEKNETIYSIAEVLHLSPTTISRYQNAEMSPKITAVEHLAEYFNVNPSWLMGFSVPKELSKDKASNKKLELLYGKNVLDLIEIYKDLNDNNKTIAIKMLSCLLESQ